MLFVQNFFQNKVPDGIKNLLEVQDEATRTLTVKYFDSQYARKTFTYCAPRYWNKLPLSIKLTNNIDTFKFLTKTAIIKNVGYTRSLNSDLLNLWH